MPQEKPIKFYMNNSLVIALTKKKIKYFMIKISSLTQDSIIYEIALQIKKLKVK